MEILLALDTVPGKIHERRSTECIGKETAQEMPDATRNAKSYSLSHSPAQSVCLPDVCGKLADRDQPHDHPQGLAKPWHWRIEYPLGNEMGSGSDRYLS